MRTAYTEDQLPGLITSWQSESETWRTPYEEKNLRLYKLYRLYLDLDETYFWESKVFIPESFTIIWTALPKMIKALLDQEPYIKIRPLRGSVVEGAKIAEALLMNQLKQINNQGLYIFLVKTIQDMLLYGNSFFDVSWRYEEAMQRRVVPIYETEILRLPTQLGLLEFPTKVYKGNAEQSELEVVYDDAEVTPIDWFDYYPDPLAISIHSRDARFGIVRQIVSEEGVEALKDVEGYKNLKDLRFTYDETSISNFDQKKEIDEVINTFGTGIGGQKKVEFLRCQWKRWNKGRYEEWLTIIADGKTVVFNDRTPYYHDQRTTIKTDCFPLNNRLYSIGMLEPAEDLCGAINQRFNQQADIITMDLSPMSKVLGSELYQKLEHLFGSTLPTVPGLLLPLSPGEDILPVHQAINIRPSQEEIAYIKNVIEETTVPKISKGVLPDRKETATGLALAQAQASERFITIMHIFFYTGLREMAQQMMGLNHQFKDIPIELQIENEQGVKEFREVSMNEVPRDGLAFEPNMAFIDPLVSRDVRAATLTETAVQLAGTPGGQVIKWPALVREIFKLRLGGFETEDLLLSEEEIAQQQQMVLQQLLQESGGQSQIGQQGQAGGGVQ